MNGRTLDRSALKAHVKHEMVKLLTGQREPASSLEPSPPPPQSLPPLALPKLICLKIHGRSLTLVLTLTLSLRRGRAQRTSVTLCVTAFLYFLMLLPLRHSARALPPPGPSLSSERLRAWEQRRAEACQPTGADEKKRTGPRPVRATGAAYMRFRSVELPFRPLAKARSPLRPNTLSLRLRQRERRCVLRNVKGG